MYRRLDELKSVRIRGKLQAAQADVRRNQKLVRLQDDLACEFSPAALAAQPVNAGQLAELFGAWGFRSLRAELEAGGGGDASASEFGVYAAGGPRQENLL